MVYELESSSGTYLTLKDSLREVRAAVFWILIVGLLMGVFSLMFLAPLMVYLGFKPHMFLPPSFLKCTRN